MAVAASAEAAGVQLWLYIVMAYIVMAYMVMAEAAGIQLWLYIVMDLYSHGPICQRPKLGPLRRLRNVACRSRRAPLSMGISVSLVWTCR